MESIIFGIKEAEGHEEREETDDDKGSAGKEKG